MKNVNIYVDSADPVCKPDDQYPSWVWEHVKNTGSERLNPNDENSVETSNSSKSDVKRQRKVIIKGKNAMLR